MVNSVPGVIALSLFILLALGHAACDKTYGVTFENQIGRAITVYRFGQKDISMEPFEVAEYGIFEFDEMLVEARDETGETIFFEVITWRALKERDWTITIVVQESRDPSPTH